MSWSPGDYVIDRPAPAKVSANIEPPLIPFLERGDFRRSAERKTLMIYSKNIFSSFFNLLCPHLYPPNKYVNIRLLPFLQHWKNMVDINIYYFNMHLQQLMMSLMWWCYFIIVYCVKVSVSHCRSGFTIPIGECAGQKQKNLNWNNLSTPLIQSSRELLDRLLSTQDVSHIITSGFTLLVSDIQFILTVTRWEREKWQFPSPLLCCFPSSLFFPLFTVSFPFHS